MKNKQIDEMAEQLYGIFGLSMPTATKVATYLTEKKGYRKASEVAREICGMLRDDLRGFVDENYLERLLTIYEKKYTEGEG